MTQHLDLEPPVTVRARCRVIWCRTMHFTAGKSTLGAELLDVPTRERRPPTMPTGPARNGRQPSGSRRSPLETELDPTLGVDDLPRRIARRRTLPGSRALLGGFL